MTQIVQFRALATGAVEKIGDSYFVPFVAMEAGAPMEGRILEGQAPRGAETVSLDALKRGVHTAIGRAVTFSHPEGGRVRRIDALGQTNTPMVGNIDSAFVDDSKFKGVARIAASKVVGTSFEQNIERGIPAEVSVGAMAVVEDSVWTEVEFDHLAILFGEPGAYSVEAGAGMPRVAAAGTGSVAVYQQAAARAGARTQESRMSETQTSTPAPRQVTAESVCTDYRTLNDDGQELALKQLLPKAHTVVADEELARLRNCEKQVEEYAKNAKEDAIKKLVAANKDVDVEKLRAMSQESLDTALMFLPKGDGEEPATDGDKGNGKDGEGRKVNRTQSQSRNQQAGGGEGEVYDPIKAAGGFFHGGAK